MTERFKIPPKECLIRFVEPGLQREVQAGKFVFIPIRDGKGQYAYVNTVKLEWDLMQEIDSWGVAPCVVQMMERMNIDVIHYCCTSEGITYVTNLWRVKQFGVLCSFGDRGTHYHLRRSYWNWVEGIQTYRHVHENRVLKLRWLEPEVA
jgi:hypothetical protein